MFNLFSKKVKKVKNKIEKLNCVILRRIINSNTFLLSTPKRKNEYFNGYIWDFIIVDVIYGLLNDVSFVAEIRAERYSELLGDLAGYQVYNLKKDGVSFNTKALISYKGVRKDLLVEMVKGIDIWSYDKILTLYGFDSQVISDSCSDAEIDSAVTEKFLIAIEPCNDGDDLLIKISNNIITTEQLSNKLAETLSMYGLSLEYQL
jgi:hypothetical protein